MASHANQHFQTLDALRGIAAIGVMLFHAPYIGELVMPSGYLAVDLFFMLSGVVIAQAYRQRMDDGLNVRSFLYRRAVRLWPMLALGAFLGIVLHGGHAGSLLLLPNWKSETNLFPANPPLWSLMMEMLAYVAFSFGLWRAGPRMLAAIALLSAASLMVLTASSEHQLVDFGAHWMTPGGGIARVAFGFATGMLIWHAWKAHGSPRHSSNGGWVAAMAMLAVMALTPLASELAALLAIFIAFPAITWWALTREISQVRAAKALGDVSYPLYCIHVPLLVAFSYDASSAATLCAALPLAALVLARTVDVPLRRYLSGIVSRNSGTRAIA